MMKDIWERQLMTGVKEMDSEHLTLIETIEELHEALQTGKGKEEVEGTLNFLKNYITIHFKHEEELQRHYGYPLVEQHKKMHVGFVKKVNELSDAVEQDATTMNIMAVTHFCMQWLKEHIGVEDRKLAEYIKEQQLKK